MMGWWCENNKFSHSFSGFKNSKNSIFQIRNNFHFIFNQVKEILVKCKGQDFPSIFNEERPFKNENDVYHAYCCFKIGNQRVRQKIENWIISNQKKS